MKGQTQSSVINPNDIRAGMIKLDSNAPSAMTKEDMQKTSTLVTFESPFSEGDNVIVIPMTQTFNGCDTPGLRITDVNHKGFRIRINELVGKGTCYSDKVHVEETIGWIAIRLA